MSQKRDLELSSSQMTSYQFFHTITFVELCQERMKYTSGNWMNLGRTPTLREVNQIDLQGTAHQNKLTVTDRYAWSIRS